MVYVTPANEERRAKEMSLAKIVLKMAKKQGDMGEKTEAVFINEPSLAAYLGSRLWISELAVRRGGEIHAI